MIDLTNIGIVSAAFFVAAASPGPATLAVAAVSMSSGRRIGLTFGLGLSIGLSFWGLVAATGLGALLQTSAAALTFLKIGGGAYLVWLAFVSGRSATRASEPTAKPNDGRQSFSAGLLLNLLNPKAVFAWMAVLALGIGNSAATLDFFVATALCSILGLLIYTFYAVLFSIPHAMRLYRRIRRWFEGMVAVLFALAGFGLLRSALTKQ